MPSVLFMPSVQGRGLNCFVLLSRANECRFETTTQNINGAFIVEQLEKLSFGLKRLTVVVLDNAPVHVAPVHVAPVHVAPVHVAPVHVAPVHVAKRVQERRVFWQERGLFLFFLPPYCPHLNIVEVLWRKLKYQWLRPQDYLESDALFYQVRQALAAVGTLLKIHFAPFQNGL